MSEGEQKGQRLAGARRAPDGRIYGNTRWPLRTMGVGDWFICTGDPQGRTGEIHSIRQLIQVLKRTKPNKTFTTVRQKDGRFLVTRSV